MPTPMSTGPEPGPTGFTPYPPALIDSVAWPGCSAGHDDEDSCDCADSPTEHPVPCEDCGSRHWPDWTLLPHEVFNAICPGGSGYLCLPCFARRVLATAPLPTRAEVLRVAVGDSIAFGDIEAAVGALHERGWLAWWEET